MAKKPETLLKEEALHAIKQLTHCWVVKIQQVAIRGTPDILLCVNGHFVALELKSQYGKLDALQAYTLAKIRQAGGISLVMNPDNFDEIIDIIEHLSLGGTIRLPTMKEIPELLPN